MRRLPLFLLLVLIALQWPLWSGYWNLYHTKKSIEAQLKTNQELVYRNAALQADIRDLKQGNDAVQERARLQLGMVKSDEVFVQIMDQPSVLTAASSEVVPTAAPAAVQTPAAPAAATVPSPVVAPAPVAAPAEPPKVEQKTLPPAIIGAPTAPAKNK